MLFDFPLTFEIPDEWWAKSGMSNFRPSRKAFRSSLNTVIVKISDVEPVRRGPGVRWFDEKRMMKILTGFVNDEEIDPIEVHDGNHLPQPIKHQYKLYDGFHRFYASAASGFESIPVIVKPYFDIRTLKT